MKNVVRQFVLEQNLDEMGNPEEFCKDAFLILEREKTAHLKDDGLPRIGTTVNPAMCLIGKFGATANYSKALLPDDLESLTSNERDLIAKYGNMFYDGSLYVPEGVHGVVVSADFRGEKNGRKTAIVEVRLTAGPARTLGYLG